MHNVSEAWAHTIATKEGINAVADGVRSSIDRGVPADGVVWNLDDIRSNARVEGTSANQTLSGTEYSDNLYGLGGNDTLYGNNGDDLLVGGLGADHLDGHAGSDRYEWSLGDGNDTLYDSSTSLTDTDRLVLTDVTADDVELYRNSASTSQTTTQTVWVVTSSGEWGDSGYWHTYTTTATVGPDSPNDLFIKVVSTDETIGLTNQFYNFANGYGIEAIEFADGTVWNKEDIYSQTRAEGSADVETLNGTTFADNLYGLDGDDTLNGHANDDLLVGGLGADYLDGGAGNDRYEWSLGDGNDTLYDSNSSTTDVDSLILTDVVSTDVDLTQTGSDMDVTIISSGEVIEVTNRFYSENTGYGIEFMAFADGVVTEILDSAVAETITTGTAGANTLNGWGFKDTLIGLEGDDTLRGYGSTDILIGGLGVDYLDGGNGGDIYRWQHLDGNDTLYDSSTSLTDTDRLVLTDVNVSDVELYRNSASTTETVTQSVWVSYGEYGGGWETYTTTTTVGPDRPNDLFIKVVSTDETIGLTNQFYNFANGYGIEAIEFADGTVWNKEDIYSQTRAEGSADVETLNGTTFADNLYGLDGDDTLNGHANDDLLVGGLGADYLDGGAGNDTASYALSLTGVIVSLENPSLNTGEAVGDSFVSIENLIGSDYNDHLSGDSNDNTFNGGDGDDLLVLGGTGSDTVKYVAGNDIDRVQGFQDGGATTSNHTIEVDVSGVDNFDDLLALASQSGDDILVDFGGGDQLIIEDVLVANLDRDAFSFV